MLGFFARSCCHLWRDININTNRGRVLGKVCCTKNLPLGEYVLQSILGPEEKRFFSKFFYIPGGDVISAKMCILNEE